jgi:hypothetical protein
MAILIVVKGFNYLRQAILCESNPTLEPVMPNALQAADLTLRRPRKEPDEPQAPPNLPVDPNVPRFCKDWEPVRSMIAKNHKDVLAGKIWW